MLLIVHLLLGFRRLREADYENTRFIKAIKTWTPGLLEEVE